MSTSWRQLEISFPPAAPSHPEERARSRQTLLITAYEETKTVYQWAAENGISAQVIYGRLEAGYSPEAAVSKWRPSKYAGTVGADLAPGEPGALSWDLLEWDEDPWAWRVVDERGEMELEEIGDLFALSKSRIEEIEKEAFAKVECALQLEEILGVARGQARWLELRGESLEEYREAVRRARVAVRLAAQVVEELRRAS